MKKNRKPSRSAGRQVVPGITLSAKKEATVAPELSDALFELALKFEDRTGMPVDVQHVLAAVVMAAGTGELHGETDIRKSEPGMETVLEKYIRIVFSEFGGQVGGDE